MYDELIAVLRHCGSLPCEGCPRKTCEGAMANMREAANAIEELSREYESVAASLTESVERVRKLRSPQWVSVMEPPKEEIVRCKDCEYWMPDGENVMVCTGPMAYSNTDEAWYCASAKRRERSDDAG